MSYRHNFSGRREQDYRNDHRPLHARRTAQYNKRKKLYCKSFIRLFCPHCHTRCLSFEDYEEHLQDSRHVKAIGRRIQIIEEEISRRRKDQRAMQAAADETAHAEGTSSSVVKYCAACDLSFYQEESRHIVSKLHVVLQKLLEPVCNICSYRAVDAVDYEHHLCSLDHLKKEERWTNELESSQQKEQSLELSQDTSQEPSSSKEVSKNSTSMETFENPMNPGDCTDSSSDPNPPSGIDKSVISKVEALHCSCCNMYFSCEGGHEAAKAKHCATKEHLVNWVKYIEDKHKVEDAGKEAVQKT